MPRNSDEAFAGIPRPSHYEHPVPRLSRLGFKNFVRRTGASAVGVSDVSVGFAWQTYGGIVSVANCEDEGIDVEVRSCCCSLAADFAVLAEEHVVGNREPRNASIGVGMN